MHIGIATTVAEAFDFIPEAADVDDKLARIAEGRRKDVSVDQLLEMIDFDHLEEATTAQWLNALISFVPALGHYKKDIAHLYQTDAAKMRIPPRRTRIHPLAPLAKNEAVITELRDAVIDILAQMGQTEESYVGRLIALGGDGLTFEKLLKLKTYLQDQETEFQRLDFLVPFLETWHTQWTYLSAIYETHFEGAFTSDPSKLGHSSTKINQKAPANLKKVDYYREAYTAYTILHARQLEIGRAHV